ncbi:MAG: hypothetical protein RJB10_967, partial [Pseudomonadota bacterium]
KAQVAHAAVVARQTKVEADALGVANVQVAIGLRREAGADFGGVQLASGLMRSVARAARPAAAGVGAVGEVVLDDLAQEVAGFGYFGCCHGGFFCRTHAIDFRRWIVVKLSNLRGLRGLRIWGWLCL